MIPVQDGFFGEKNLFSFAHSARGTPAYTPSRRGGKENPRRLSAHRGDGRAGKHVNRVSPSPMHTQPCNSFARRYSVVNFSRRIAFPACPSRQLTSREFSKRKSSASKGIDNTCKSL